MADARRGLGRPLAIRYLPGIRDDLAALPPTARSAAKEALQGLAAGARDVQTKRLRGDLRKPIERMKVGAWRVAFYRDGDTIYIVQVFPRSAGYDWLSLWQL